MGITNFKKSRLCSVNMFTFMKKKPKCHYMASY